MLCNSPASCTQNVISKIYIVLTKLMCNSAFPGTKVSLEANLIFLIFVLNGQNFNGFFSTLNIQFVDQNGLSFPQDVYFCVQSIDSPHTDSPCADVVYGVYEVCLKVTEMVSVTYHKVEIIKQITFSVLVGLLQILCLRYSARKLFSGAHTL